MNLDKILIANPTDTNARINLAAAYISRGANLFNKKINLANAANDYRAAIFYLKYDENIPPETDAKENLSIANSNLTKTLTALKLDLSPKGRLKIAKNLRGHVLLKESVVEYDMALANAGLRPESLEALGDVMWVLEKNHAAIDYYGKALTLNPDDGNLHLKIARPLYRIGNFDAAVKEYNIALDSQGNKADSPERKEIISAIESMWKSRIQDDPNNAPAHMNLGVVLQKKGDFQEAMAQYKAAEMIEPGNPMIRLNLATLFQAQGNTDMAIKAYNTILEIRPNDVLVHYYKGTALKQANMTRDAINEFQIALNINPNFLLARKELLDTLMHSSTNPDEVLAIMADYARNNQNDAIAQYNFAFELHSQKKIDDAMTYYQKAIQLDPKLIDAYLNLASIYKEKANYPEALTTLQTALKIDPANTKVKDVMAQINTDSSTLIYQQAIEKHNKGNYTAAIADYIRVLEINKSNPDVYISLGAAYQALKKTDEAINAYNKALELDKNNSSALYYLGSAYYNKKNYAKAKDLYEKALAVNPEKTDATMQKDIKDALADAKIAESDDITQKAIKEYNAKRYIKSLEILNAAVKQYPDNATAYYYRGMVYDALKKYSFAVENYKKSVEKSKDMNVAYYSIAIDYDLLKNKTEAKRFFGKFLELSGTQDNEYTKYARQRVKHL